MFQVYKHPSGDDHVEYVYSASRREHWIPRTKDSETSREQEETKRFNNLLRFGYLMAAVTFITFLRHEYDYIDSALATFMYTLLFYALPTACLCLEISQGAGLSALFCTSLVARLCFVPSSPLETTLSTLLLAGSLASGIVNDTWYGEHMYLSPGLKGYIIFVMYGCYMLVRSYQTGRLSSSTATLVPLLWVGSHVVAFFVSRVLRRSHRSGQDNHRDYPEKRVEDLPV